MKSFSILSHTADVRLKVEGTTLEELFESSLEGMNKIISQKNYPDDLESSFWETIAVTSSDVTTLLIDFLSQVLTKTHIHCAVFFKMEFRQLTENYLEADIYGIKIDSFGEDIKAVTYHEAEVQRNKKGNYETVIVFDI